MHRPMNDWLDSASLAASALCTVHCLLLPLMVASTPLLSRWLDLGEHFHVGVVLFAVPVSTVALVGGWREHGRTLTIVLGLVGLGTMTAGLFASDENSETVWTVAGSVSLALAHGLNWCWRRRPTAIGVDRGR